VWREWSWARDVLFEAAARPGNRPVTGNFGKRSPCICTIIIREPGRVRCRDLNRLTPSQVPDRVRLERSSFLTVAHTLPAQARSGRCITMSRS
jgi:hypothetical protein